MLVSAGPEAAARWAEKGGISMCVFTVRKNGEYVNIWDGNIRVHNLKKIVNYLLCFCYSMFPCPFAYSKLFQPTLEVSTPLRPGSSCSPKAEGSMLFVGETGNLSWFDVPGIWLLHPIQWFCQNSFLVLMKPLRGLQATLPSLQGLWSQFLCSSSW